MYSEFSVAPRRAAYPTCLITGTGYEIVIRAGGIGTNYVLTRLGVKTIVFWLAWCTIEIPSLGFRVTCRAIANVIAAEL